MEEAPRRRAVGAIRDSDCSRSSGRPDGNHFPSEDPRKPRDEIANDTCIHGVGLPRGPLRHFR